MSVPATAEPNTPAPGAEALSTGRTEPNAQEQRAGPTQTSSEATQEQESRGPDYIRDAFRRLRGYTQTAAPAPQRDRAEANATGSAPQAPPASSAASSESERSEARPATPQESSRPATTLPPRQEQERPATQGAPGRVYTDADLQRLIQSEADRILAKRQKDEETRNAQERERELRRTNPFEYARLMEEKETELEASRAETQRLTDVVGKQLFFYDRAVLDTFVSALPAEERAKVIAPDGDGIENRKKTAANTLKALRSRWIAEGRASAKTDLMKDQTFIKEILARFGSAAPEPQSAPVAVRPASDATPHDGTSGMNAWIRGAAQTARATTGR